MRARYFIKWVITSLSFSLILLGGVELLAQDTGSNSSAPAAGASATKPTKEKKQSLSFEDELVEGATQKPELFYLFQKKNFNYKRLIRLRENFLPEMRQTAEEVQRTRGGN